MRTEAVQGAAVSVERAPDRLERSEFRASRAVVAWAACVSAAPAFTPARLPLLTPQPKRPGSD